MISKEELKARANEFQFVLEKEVKNDDPELLLSRLTELENVMVESGKFLSICKYYQDEEQGKLKEIIKEVGDVSPSTLNNYVKSKTKEENFLVNWFERINRSATHLLENMRTVISYRKEEMRNLNYKI